MLILLLAAAMAAPSLDLATDVAQPGLRTWWREGELVVGVGEGEDQTALRPLVDLAPTQRPGDLSKWTEVGAQCPRSGGAGASPSKPLKASAQHEGQTLTAELSGEPGTQVVRVLQGTRVVGSQALGRPVQGCELRLVQADKLPGLELVLAWRFGEGEALIHGLMVYRIAESATAPEP